MLLFLLPLLFVLPLLKFTFHALFELLLFSVLDQRLALIILPVVTLQDIRENILSVILFIKKPALSGKP